MKHIIELSENVSYDDVWETMINEAESLKLSQDEIWAVWQAGIATVKPQADEPILTEDEIFRAALLNPTPDTCPDCGSDNLGAWICYDCGHEFEQPDNISPTELGLMPEV